MMVARPVTFGVRRRRLTLANRRGLCGSLTTNVSTGLTNVAGRSVEGTLDSFRKMRRHLRGITHMHNVSFVGSSGTAGMGSY